MGFMKLITDLHFSFNVVLRILKESLCLDYVVTANIILQVFFIGVKKVKKAIIEH